MKTFRQALQGAGFFVTAGIDTGNQASVDHILQQAARLAGAVDAIQLDGDGAGISHVALSALLLQQGIDPVPRLNCRDRNRISLQSELLGLRAVGVSSLIISRGLSFPEQSDSAAKPVHDLRCRELIAMAHEINEENWPGEPHEFMIGTESEPAAPEEAWNDESLLARAGAGARFLQIRPCADLALLQAYMQRLVESRVTWKYSVVAGLAPPGPGREGIASCVGMMRAVADIPGVSGIYLPMSPDAEATVSAIASSGLT